jgi:hypothetical protein
MGWTGRIEASKQSGYWVKSPCTDMNMMYKKSDGSCWSWYSACLPCPFPKIHGYQQLIAFRAEIKMYTVTLLHKSGTEGRKKDIRVFTSDVHDLRHARSRCLSAARHL